MQVIDKRFFNDMIFDTFNNLVWFTKNGKRYSRSFKSSYDTKNKSFGYAIFRFDNVFYKVKM